MLFKPPWYKEYRKNEHKVGSKEIGNKVDKGILTHTFKKYQLSKDLGTIWINSYYMWFIYNFHLSWTLPHIS